MNKTILTIIIAFLVGFGVAKFAFPSSKNVEPTSSAECEEIQKAKETLISFSKSEYQDYLKIKDEKLKYEKADELLGKVMVLFLADIGFKQITPAKADATIQTSPSTPPATVSSSASENLTEPDHQQTATSPAPADPKALTSSDQIKTASAQADFKSLLDKAAIENIKVEVANSSFPTATQFKVLQGHFTGEIQFLKSQRQPATAVLDLIPTSSNSTSGEYSLSLQGSGLNSQSTNHGKFNSVSTMANDSNAFLITTCGGSCYLQLYYSNSTNSLLGNFYETKNGKAARTGTIFLQKQL